MCRRSFGLSPLRRAGRWHTSDDIVHLGMSRLAADGRPERQAADGHVDGGAAADVRADKGQDAHHRLRRRGFRGGCLLQDPGGCAAKNPIRLLHGLFSVVSFLASGHVFAAPCAADAAVSSAGSVVQEKLLDLRHIADRAGHRAGVQVAASGGHPATAGSLNMTILSSFRSQAHRLSSSTRR